jgi:hypothetical protein
MLKTLLLKLKVMKIITRSIVMSKDQYSADESTEIAEI